MKDLQQYYYQQNHQHHYKNRRLLLWCECKIKFFVIRYINYNSYIVEIKSNFYVPHLEYI